MEQTVPNVEPQGVTTRDASPDVVTQQTWDEAIQPTDSLSAVGSGLSAVGKPLQSTNFIEGQQGWRLDSNGLVQAVGFEGINMKVLKTAEFAETLSPGTPVGVDWEGKIAKAMRNFQDDATNQFSNLNTMWRVMPYTQNNFIVVYTDTSGASFKVYAVIATVSSTTNNLTFGTPQLIDALGGEGYRNGDVCQIDTNTYVAVYSDGVGGEDNYATAFTVSGSTITVGTTKTLSTTNNLEELRCCKIDTLNFFWCGYRDSFSDWDMGTATVSGTTVTTEHSSSSGITNISSVSSKDIILAQVGTDKLAMLQTTNGYVAIITTNGSITAGTAVDLFDTTGDRFTASVLSSSNDTFFAHLGTKTGYFTISGTTPSLQGSLVTRTGSDGGLVKLGSSVYDFQSNPTDDQNAGLWSVTQAGSSAILTQLNGTLKKSGVISGAVASDGYRIFALASDLSYWISSMSYNFIGVVQEATARGSSGKVLIRGVDTNQTGLVSGSYYLVTNGTLSRLSPIETVNTLDDVVNVVKAISSTEILI